jgi:hypothetical protein
MTHVLLAVPLDAEEEKRALPAAGFLLKRDEEIMEQFWGF